MFAMVLYIRLKKTVRVALDGILVLAHSMFRHGFVHLFLDIQYYLHWFIYIYLLIRYLCDSLVYSSKGSKPPSGSKRRLP